MSPCNKNVTICNKIVITEIYNFRINRTEKFMNYETLISDSNMEKLAQKMAKSFSVNQEEAMAIMYEEWDLVENLFHAYGKVKTVHQHLISELNAMYRIA